MRKAVMALVLSASVALAGCAGTMPSLSSIGTGIGIVTKSVANPVTENELYEIEASVNIAVKALVAYRRACLAGSADKNCRANIAAVQRYTRQLPPYLVQLRTFVRNNDQLNATNTYNALVALFTQAKQTATALGVNLGGST